MKKKIIVTIVAIVVVFGTVLFFGRARISNTIVELKKKNIPAPTSYDQVRKKIAFVNGSIETVDIISVEADLKLPKQDTPIPEESVLKIPEEFNLDIPFTSQAPNAIWDEIHKEACEETSALMAAYFVLGKDISSPNTADRDILKIVEWQKRYFGFWKDTDASQTAEILKNYFGLKDVEVKYDITLDDIKREIAQGYPVIIPAAGRELGNPYYTPPGPYYHMLVVKGYTKTGIITNDPGTKRGEDFVYNNDVFYNAIHDWNKGDVINGRKAMIVVKK